MWTSAIIGSALCPFLFVCLFVCLFRTDPTGLLGFIWECNYVTLTFSIDMQSTLINQSTPVFRITVTAVCRLHQKGQPESYSESNINARGRRNHVLFFETAHCHTGNEKTSLLQQWLRATMERTTFTLLKKFIQVFPWLDICV